MVTAMVTPMKPDGSIDYDGVKKLAEHLVANGHDGLVVNGTTGESATLTVAEHTDVIRRTVEAVAGRLPVIAGTGANATAEAIHLTEAARADGADAALLVVPYYNKPPQEGLYRHFRAVAEAVDSFLVRPGCMAGAAWLLRPLPGGVWLGFAVGKAAADVAWYGLEASARRGASWSAGAGRTGGRPATPYLASSVTALTISRSVSS